jgi:protein O-GlcNAc transferase
LLVSPTCNEKKMLQEAKKYEAFFLSNVEKKDHRAKDVSRNKILTIGYLCHFFHNAPSQTLLLPYLRTHNRNRFRIICYSDARSDLVSEDIRKVADTWRDVYGMSDDDLASLIQSDDVDILLELNGYCGLNRYGVIARRAAPIQVSHYNLSATTGLSAMDYVLLGQEFVVNQQCFTETVYYHKGIRKALAFPYYFPPCTSLPYDRNKFITFGSFGASHKVNRNVIRLWCEILNAVPGSRLLFKASTLSEIKYLEIFKYFFKLAGGDLSRVVFEGHSEHAEMLLTYADVDIALDTFPYSGATTCREALWQGVPVITLCDEEKYCLQHGKAILTSMGHPELVAESQKAYVMKAVELSNNIDQLRKYRETLREDFKRSPLTDLETWTANLEDAYLDMWEKYVTSADLEEQIALPQ